MTERPLPAGPVQHDDDGNIIPTPSPNTDLADLIQLLEYSRVKGFRVVGPIRVGKITTTIVDTRQVATEQRAAVVDTTPDVWESVGYHESDS